MQWIAALILWVGHSVPAIGQHIGYSANSVWIEIGARIVWISF